jgi:hypothetical protein
MTSRMETYLSDKSTKKFQTKNEKTWDWEKFKNVFLLYKFNF